MSFKDLINRLRGKPTTKDIHVFKTLFYHASTNEEKYKDKTWYLCVSYEIKYPGITFSIKPEGARELRTRYYIREEAKLLKQNLEL